MRNVIIGFVIGIFWFLSLSSCADQVEKEWIDLFNGVDLTGWEQLEMQSIV